MKKDDKISCRLSKGQKNKLRKIASEHGITLSNAIRISIDRCINNENINLLNFKFMNSEEGLIDDGLYILESNEMYKLIKNNNKILIYPKYKYLSCKFDELLRGKVLNYDRSPYHVEFIIDDNFKLDKFKNIINKFLKEKFNYE